MCQSSRQMALLRAQTLEGLWLQIWVAQRAGRCSQVEQQQPQALPLQALLPPLRALLPASRTHHPLA